MRILFLNKLESFIAPVGLCQISAVAKAAGHETFLCEMNSEDYMDAMLRVQPDVFRSDRLSRTRKTHPTVRGYRRGRRRLADQPPTASL